MLGCSSGAFAAILFGHILQANFVLAFSPQTVISSDMENVLGDIRFKQIGDFKFLRSAFPKDPFYQQSLDLKQLLPFRTRVILHFSQGEAFDEKHALRIGCPTCVLIPHECKTHLLALELRDRGELDWILEQVLHAKMARFWDELHITC